MQNRDDSAGLYISCVTLSWSWVIVEYRYSVSNLLDTWYRSGLYTSIGWCREGAGPAVVVQGTPMEVNLALSQDDARSLAHGAAMGPASDARNLYLV